MEARKCIVSYCIVYRYFRSVSQTEALSVHFSSRRKVKLKARERETRKGEQQEKASENEEQGGDSRVTDQ